MKQEIKDIELMGFKFIEKKNMVNTHARITGIYDGMYSKEILDAMDPSRLYPRWEKRIFGTHWVEDPCDCNCQCDCPEGYEEPDKDAVELDWWVPYMLGIFGLLPKVPWKDPTWRINENKIK